MENWSSTLTLLRHEEETGSVDPSLNLTFEDNLTDSSGYDSNSNSDENEFLNSCEVSSDNSQNHSGSKPHIFEKEGRCKIEEVETLTLQSECGVLESLQYALSLPDMCDATFLVGPDKMPVNGIRAIMASRSRFLFQMMLQQEKEKTKTGKNSKIMSSLRRKSSSSPLAPGRLTIHIKNYGFYTFKQFIYFVHCGKAIIDSENVKGLLCASREFDLKDLNLACRDYIHRVADSGQVDEILKSCSDPLYSSKRTVQLVARKIEDILMEQKSGLAKKIAAV